MAKKKDGAKPKRTNKQKMSVVKMTVRGLFDVQKQRIAQELRSDGLERDGIMSKKEADEFYKLPLKRLEDAEKAMEAVLAREIKDLPIMRWLRHIRGIGPRLSGLTIACLDPISDFDNVAKVWAFAGLALKPHLVQTGLTAKRQGREWFVFDRDGKKLGGKYKDETVATIAAKEGDPQELEAYDILTPGVIRFQTVTRSTVYNQDEKHMEIVEKVSDWQEAPAGRFEVRRMIQKRRRGSVSNWSAELKQTAWKIGQSINKCGGKYRTFMNGYKTRIVEREVANGNIIWGSIEFPRIPSFADACAGLEIDDVTLARIEQFNELGDAALSDDELDNAPRTKDGDVSTSTKYVALHYDRKRVVVPDRIPCAPDWTVGRIHNMGIRWVAKQYFAHLWEVWRTMEGLPVRRPYAEEYLGHTSIGDPWDFVDTDEDVRPKAADDSIEEIA